MCGFIGNFVLFRDFENRLTFDEVITATSLVAPFLEHGVAYCIGAFLGGRLSLQKRVTDLRVTRYDATRGLSR